MSKQVTSKVAINIIDLSTLKNIYKVLNIAEHILEIETTLPMYSTIKTILMVEKRQKDYVQLKEHDLVKNQT